MLFIKLRYLYEGQVLKVFIIIKITKTIPINFNKSWIIHSNNKKSYMNYLCNLLVSAMDSSEKYYTIYELKVFKKG